MLHWEQESLGFHFDLLWLNLCTKLHKVRRKEIYHTNFNGSLDICNSQIHAHNPKSLAERDCTCQTRDEILFAYSYEIPKMVPRKPGLGGRDWVSIADNQVKEARVYQPVSAPACCVTSSLAGCLSNLWIWQFVTRSINKSIPRVNQLTWGQQEALLARVYWLVSAAVYPDQSTIW